MQRVLIGDAEALVALQQRAEADAPLIEGPIFRTPFFPRPAPRRPDALSEIAQIARNAILLANQLQRKLDLERALHVAALKRLDAILALSEASRAEF